MIRRFLKGEINRDEYGRYLTSLYFVYRYVEHNDDDDEEWSSSIS